MSPGEFGAAFAAARWTPSEEGLVAISLARPACFSECFESAVNTPLTTHERAKFGDGNDATSEPILARAKLFQ